MLNKTILQAARTWALPLLALLFLASCQKMGPVPPPWKNQAKKKTIWEVASSDGRFSLLKAAVARTGLVPALNDKKANLTVFAPTEAYHVIVGARVFSSDLVNGSDVPTFQGSTLEINLGSGARVKGNANTTASNIFITDLLATNGVVHVIDQVLLP